MLLHCVAAKVEPFFFTGHLVLPWSSLCCLPCPVKVVPQKWVRRLLFSCSAVVYLRMASRRLYTPLKLLDLLQTFSGIFPVKYCCVLPIHIFSFWLFFLFHAAMKLYNDLLCVPCGQHSFDLTSFLQHVHPLHMFETVKG